jgi:hypothetical protein
VKTGIENTPHTGDIISVNRGLYKHFGIYAADSRVIQFAPKKGFEINPADADIVETTLAEFLKGGELCVDRSSGGAFSPSETVRRARSQIGTQKGRYDLVFHNCEHFARWCKYGIAESRQVENAVAGLVIGVSAAAITIGIIDALGDNKKRVTHGGV